MQIRVGNVGVFRIRYMRMVREKDREHFRRIAAIEVELNHEAICAAAAPSSRRFRPLNSCSLPVRLRSAS